MRNVNGEKEKGLISEKFLSPLHIKSKRKRQIGLQNIVAAERSLVVGIHSQPDSGLQIRFLMYLTDEDGHRIPLYLVLHCVSAWHGGLDELHLPVRLIKDVDV